MCPAVQDNGQRYNRCATGKFYISIIRGDRFFWTGTYSKKLEDLHLHIPNRSGYIYCLCYSCKTKEKKDTSLIRGSHIWNRITWQSSGETIFEIITWPCTFQLPFRFKHCSEVQVNYSSYMNMNRTDLILSSNSERCTNYVRKNMVEKSLCVEKTSHICWKKKMGFEICCQVSFRL